MTPSLVEAEELEGFGRFVHVYACAQIQVAPSTYQCHLYMYHIKESAPLQLFAGFHCVSSLLLPDDTRIAP